jgi:hypothetical protein
MPPVSPTAEEILDPVQRPAPTRSHKKKAAAKPAANPVAEQRLRELEAKDPARKAPAKTAKARSALAERLRQGLEDFPSIDILERRLMNPEGAPSEPIRLRDQSEPMEIRWINTEIPGRYHDVTRYGGYVPVKMGELLDPKEVSDLQESPDGVVTRGERGKEVLMKMPKRYYDAIQRKRSTIEQNRLRNSRNVKNELMEAAGSQSHTYKDTEGNTVTVSGDEAAHRVGAFFGEVKSYRETIQFTDEAEA